MKPKNIFALLAALSLGISAASAGLMTYGTKSSFLADLQSGYFLNDLSVLPAGVVQNNFDSAYFNVGFTNGSPAVGYRISAGDGVYFTGSPINCVATWSPADTLIVTSTTTNVLTFGANLFLTDFNGAPTPGTLTVKVNFTDGSALTNTMTSTSSTTSFGFFGASSDIPISSVTISTASQYVTLGNLYASAKVSIPSTTVSVVATVRNATQTGPTPGVFTITRSNVTNDYSAALPVTFVLSGTATNGIYTCSPAGILPAVTNTITIQAGRQSTNITINAVVFTNAPRASTFVVLSLLRGNGYATNAPTSDVIAIQGSGPQLVSITNISLVGASAGLNFTSAELTDGIASFAVQSSATVNGTYVDVSPAATITQSGPGIFQATVTASGDNQFYRIRHL